MYTELQIEAVVFAYFKIIQNVYDRVQIRDTHGHIHDTNIYLSFFHPRASLVAKQYCCNYLFQKTEKPSFLCSKNCNLNRRSTVVRQVTCAGSKSQCYKKRFHEFVTYNHTLKLYADVCLYPFNVE